MRSDFLGFVGRQDGMAASWLGIGISWMRLVLATGSDVRIESLSWLQSLQVRWGEKSPAIPTFLRPESQRMGPARLLLIHTSSHSPVTKAGAGEGPSGACPPAGHALVLSTTHPLLRGSRVAGVCDRTFYPRHRRQWKPRNSNPSTADSHSSIVVSSLLEASSTRVSRIFSKEASFHLLCLLHTSMHRHLPHRDLLWRRESANKAPTAGNWQLSVS